MKAVPLTVFPRTQLQRSGVKKVRGSSRVPAVIYGRQYTSQPLEMNLLDYERLVHHSASENILLNLDVQGDARPHRLALIQEVQHHPLSAKVLHVDLHEVAEDEKVAITVPVETVGEASGVKNGGGILEHVLFKLKVRALPKDLPEVIRVDVSALEVGQSIHIGEIPVPANIELLGDKKISVISVAAPMTEAQEAAETAAATETVGEPEVLREKKEEGEAGATEGGAKTADKGAAKAPEKGAEKAADKGADKKAGEKAAEKKPEKKK